MSVSGNNKHGLGYPNSIVDEEWEYLDPTPDIHALFIQFDDRFFWSKLRSVVVKWSPRMTVCAGLCRYEGRRSGHCSISLSVPLLKLRPRRDLVETLLHEMIHAYLFLTNNNRDRDGHGPEFQHHMHRINKESGTRITIYHSFHDEVRLYKQHWWKCNGPCQHQRPFYGLVKRSMNRAPGPNDLWWAEHKAKCGGFFTKIKEPEGYGEKKKKENSGKNPGPDPKKLKTDTATNSQDIRNFLNGAGPSQSDRIREITNETKKPYSTSPPSSSKDIRGFFRTSSEVPSPTKPSLNSKPLESTSAAKPISTTKGKSLVGSGVMVKNRGSSTFTVKDSDISPVEPEQSTTAKPTKGGIVSSASAPIDFVPFAGTGHVLGSREKPEVTPSSSNFAKVPALANTGALDAPGSKFTERFKSSSSNATIQMRSGHPCTNGVKPGPSKSLSKLPSPKRPTLSGRGNSVKVETVTLDDSREENSSSSPVPCPVCNNEFRLDEINSHLDSCLS